LPLFFLQNLGTLQQLGDLPSFGAGHRAAFNDLDEVTRLGVVVCVVRVIFLRARDDLAVHRVLNATLDEHSGRLLHLVANHTTHEGAVHTSLISHD